MGTAALGRGNWRAGRRARDSALAGPLDRDTVFLGMLTSEISLQLYGTGTGAALSP
jgi:hypothetical protein